MRLFKNLKATFSRVLSCGLQKENKLPMLKRSIAGLRMFIPVYNFWANEKQMQLTTSEQ